MIRCHLQMITPGSILDLSCFLIIVALPVSCNAALDPFPPSRCQCDGFFNLFCMCRETTSCRRCFCMSRFRTDIRSKFVCLCRRDGLARVVLGRLVSLSLEHVWWFRSPAQYNSYDHLWDFHFAFGAQASLPALNLGLAGESIHPMSQRSLCECWILTFLIARVGSLTVLWLRYWGFGRTR